LTIIIPALNEALRTGARLKERSLHRLRVPASRLARFHEDIR
jgi:hypothetical protein